jgi:hypothetical protein
MGHGFGFGGILHHVLGLGLAQPLENLHQFSRFFTSTSTGYASMPLTAAERTFDRIRNLCSRCGR